jgi:ribonucleotide reductase beta subunit family protein with ferritin-like domain
MDADRRHFVKMQLGFLAQSDMIILANLGTNFAQEVDCMEAQFAYTMQAAQECVHTESYNLQIDAIMSGEEREKVFLMVRDMPSVKLMREWALRWLDKRISLKERIIAQAIFEGVFFSASFSALQWLRTHNLLPGITSFNSFIARDEGIHTELGCLITRARLSVRPGEAVAHAMCRSAIRVMDGFVSESLPVSLADIDAKHMQQYVRFQADCVMRSMKYSAIYEVKNPFGFMDKLSLNGILKTNFFEHRVDAYQNIIHSGATKLTLDATPVTY